MSTRVPMSILASLNLGQLLTHFEHPKYTEEYFFDKLEEYRAKKRLSVSLCRARKTSDQKAEYLAKCREYSLNRSSDQRERDRNSWRKWYQKARSAMTPEEIEVYREKKRLSVARCRARKKALELQNTASN